MQIPQPNHLTMWIEQKFLYQQSASFFGIVISQLGELGILMGYKLFVIYETDLSLLELIWNGLDNVRGYYTAHLREPLESYAQWN